MKLRIIGHLFFFVLILSLSSVCAQNLPKGRFLSDSMKIGQPVQYSVTYAHPSDLEIFFPDSSDFFYPFEFIKKDFFPTKSANNISNDSIVYTLTTYELSPVVYLAVPVFVVEQGDSSTLNSESDSIVIVPLITQASDSLSFKSNTNLQTIDSEMDMWYWGIGTVVLLSVLVFIFFVFRKPILRYFRLQRLKREHTRFTTEFENALRGGLETSAIEKALSGWKVYAEILTEKPITSLTTKEMTNYIPDENLQIALKNIDRAIYANLLNEQTQDALGYLRNFATEIYLQKIEEVRNG